MQSAKPIHRVKIHEHPDSPLMVYTKGQSVDLGGKKGVITDIEKDEDHYLRFGVLIVTIYVENEPWAEYPYSAGGVVKSIHYDQSAE